MENNVIVNIMEEIKANTLKSLQCALWHLLDKSIAGLNNRFHLKLPYFGGMPHQFYNPQIHVPARPLEKSCVDLPCASLLENLYM